MTGWTHAGEHLPWLRGQSFYIAATGSQPVVRRGLVAAGYSIADADTGGAGSLEDVYTALAAALLLPSWAADELDAFVEALRELPSRWPGARRIALLWRHADALVQTDLLSWTIIAQVLRDASAALWTPAEDQRLVFDTIAFVPREFGADEVGTR